MRKVFIEKYVHFCEMQCRAAESERFDKKSDLTRKNTTALSISIFEVNMQRVYYQPGNSNCGHNQICKLLGNCQLTEKKEKKLCN